MGSVLLLALLLAEPQSAASSRCSTPEHRQFDFWIGDWVVHTREGKEAGTSHIEKIEDGCGILERWRNARGITGRSINIYRPVSQTWVQAWAGSDGLTLVLEGKFESGQMRLEGESQAPTGERVRDRVTWSRSGDSTVRQFWEQSADGKTWNVAFDGIYTRKATQ